VPRLRGGIKVAETEGPLRFSSKRARAYKRGFDHDVARHMLANGMTARQVAEHFGVSKSAIYKMKLAKTGTEQVVFPVINTCPRCFRRKGKNSTLCRKCSSETRMPEPTPVEHPLQLDVALYTVRHGRIVRYRGEYAVVEPHGPTNVMLKQLHYWDAPPEVVRGDVEVDVMPYTEWVVDS